MDNKSAISIKDEIWSILRKTSQQINTLSVETDRLRISQKEISQQIEKMSSELSASQKETDEQMKKTDEQMKKTDIRINTMIGDFGNRWGKLGENLVKGNLAKRLKERGIKVERVITNAKHKSSEFDIIAINGKEVVVVEVKATLDPSDVNEFKDDIEQFKVWWPEFKDKTIYGAMAFLIRANKQADNLAQKQGFFVISATGDVIIQNKEDFKPKVFS